MSNSEQRKRNKKVDVRVTDQEYEIITTKASTLGESNASYMRKCALGRKMRPSMDSNVINELRRLGGMQKHLFTQGGGVLSHEYAAILVAIKERIAQIGN